ncbi:DUF1987 domain-containing protein [Plebeiibacterium sediminum]|uniref:DUF1987 domain-containing protein n=1 Tax=Plebeiibacterium sediminum TaxID=2992112 RepID=A0AAE3M5N6_9BACT|nr:DUF1987 domain-containing protein [Plebeiobacterium sediminum]MCW3787299.1 DUF1987 domain-containing protein [Plebeiobacterium sediminum]
MKPLVISETSKTPFVYFNQNEGKFFIGGKSIPEDAYAFYASVISWLENLVEETVQNVELTIILDIINVGSIKHLYRLIKGLEGHYLKGKEIMVKWYLEKSDEDMHEISTLFQQELKIPITMVTID